MTRPLHATEHCRHYSQRPGLSGGPHCAVGLDLSAPGASRPCWSSPTEPCPKREEYTDAERASWRAYQAEGMAKLTRAVEAIPAPIPLGTVGKCKCPNCDAGDLRWQRASNGHVWLQCTTHDCLGPVHFNIRRDTVWPASKAVAP